MTPLAPTNTTPTAVTAPRRRFWQGETLWAFVAALVVGLVYGRVGVANLTTGLVGGQSNGYENYWNDWWFRVALQGGRSPFFTDAIFAPNGVSLRFHTLNPLGCLLALPLAPLVGPVGAMNLKFLAALIGAVFFAWLLFRDATGSGTAAFAGAAVYGLASDQTVTYWGGGAENYLMGTALLPVFLWLMLRAVSARPRPWLWAAGAVCALLALCLADWQYTMFAVVVTFVYFACVLLTRRPWRAKAQVFLRLAVIGGAWLAVVAVPLLVPMLREARESPWLAASGQAVQLSRSLSQFVTPGTSNPGYLVLVVGAVGLLLWWRQSRGPDAPGVSDAPQRGERFTVAFWVAVAVVGVVCALGPYLKLVPGRTGTDIPLPYAAIYQLPVFSVGRRPQLFYFIALLGFGALLAFAVREVTRWLRQRLAANGGGRVTRFAASPALPVAVVAALLVPTLAPFMAETGAARAVPLRVPPFYRDVLAHDPEPYAILELPSFAESGRGENWPALQTVHGKQIFDGSISRDHGLESPTIFVKRATFFRDAFYLAKPQQRDLLRPARVPDILPTPAYEQIGVPLLRFYRVRYVVLWFQALRDLRPDGVEFADGLVRGAIGDVQPTYEDGLMRVYRVPEVAPEPSASPSPLFLDVGSTGWYPAERGADGAGFRWANGGSAELLAFNLSPARARATLRLTVFNYQTPRTVALAINGYALGTYTFDRGESRNLSLTFDLPPGMNALILTSAEPANPAAASLGSRDNRQLRFGVRGVGLTAAAP